VHTNEPTASAAATATAFPLADYQFPASIDPAGRYLFYLHGKIIEDQGLPAVSPEFGEYEYEAILKRLGSSGLIVISEQRPKDADGLAYARRTREQVATLENAGVPAQHITVVGASKGASIAALSSSLIEDPMLNFVLLGSCHSSTIEEWRGSGMRLYGNVLAIYDFADEEYSGSCEEMFQLSEGKGLGLHSEIVLQVGTGHGILYKPLDEWIEPTLEWASR